jgi:hypothetical protein
MINNNILLKSNQYKKLKKSTYIPLESVVTTNYITYNLNNLKITSNNILTYIIKNSFKKNFKYLTFTLFKSFFINSNVDIPKSLLSLKTLVNPINQLSVYKFNKYLARHGNFIKPLIEFNKA